MITFFKRCLIPCMILFTLSTSCRKQAFDEYYGRPDWLESAIYTRLQEEGRFSMLLNLIDKSGYDNTLNQAGYWTFFAPNDEAVTAFLREQNINSVDEVSAELAEKIVRYALVYNAFKTDRISDYQSSQGWIENEAFRRRTAYYEEFRKETIRINGVQTEAIVTDQNTLYGYLPIDNNNKYLTYFHSGYVTQRGLAGNDYSFFYPGVTWTDFNLLGAKVVKADIIAENGVVHEVDKVSLPPLSLDQYLVANDEYSFFRDSLLNQFFVTYQPNETASKTYEYRTGQVGQVYIKSYDPLLGFALNSESYLREEDNDAQRGAFSLFIPKNDVLIPWVRTVLLEHYKTLNNVPKAVLADFVNTMLWREAVWPSQFANSTNIHEEPARFELTDIADKKILSNGFFYGTNIMQESNLFNTVYKHVILDPEYSLMLNLLNKEYKNFILNPDKQYTIFLFSNRLLSQLGYVYNERISEWTWRDRNNNVIGHNITEPRLQRILYTHIVETPNDELANIATTSGFIQTGDNVIPGEYIKWNSGKMYAAGNEYFNQPVQISGSAKFGNNGRVYYVDNLLEFSAETVGAAITRVATANANVSRFREYFINSSHYRPADLTFNGIAAGAAYTILMPDNESIAAAIEAGWLPANPASTDLVDKTLIDKFVQYHILTNINIAPDGNRDILSGITLLKDDNDQSLIVGIENEVSNLRILDAQNRRISVVNNANLYFSNRIVLHELNGFLIYNN